MKELVLPDCYATVLDGAIVRREGFCVDEETADNSYEVRAHGILPSMPRWHFLTVLRRKQQAPHPWNIFACASSAPLNTGSITREASPVHGRAGSSCSSRPAASVMSDRDLGAGVDPAP